ncbi:MAG: DUF192 domain-containing protein [Gammaproteobacteria bacterium]|nr:DUF192 domain-containing protein [Gammaproteobacteria bacterium]
MKSTLPGYRLPLLLALVLLLHQSLSASEVFFESIKLEIAGSVFELEIAKTPKQRQQGLMYRQELPDRAGMIFLYPYAGNNRIWMKNTLIPLTVIWLDDNAKIIDIKKLKPCRQQNCPVFGVDRPSKFIIELNVQFNALKPGDRIPALLSL